MVGPSRKPRCSNDKLLVSREVECVPNLTKNEVPFSSTKLPFVWERRILNPGSRNKIFACQWITNNHVVYGTKCNSLVLYDCSSNESIDIPLIRSKDPDPMYLNPCACGIHSIQLNPSKTFLATGGANVNHIGIYKLSELSPHCLLRDCHNDWVFDLRWLDDQYLASCSRDSSLAIWKLPDGPGHVKTKSNDSIIKENIHNSYVPIVNKPVASAVSTTTGDRFRALEYLPLQNGLAVVSMSRRLYLYDTLRMGCDKSTRPIYTLILRDAYQEAVALRRWSAEPNCIALATHHCVLIFDVRCSTFKIGAAARCVLPPLDVSGVRSLNFSGSVLSYGTSAGQVHFYDLRADHHLPLMLDVGPGWLKQQSCQENEIASLPGQNAVPSPLVDSISPNWTVAPPPPSPAHPLLLTQPLNMIPPLQLRTEVFSMHVSNLRERLERIHHRLSILRERRNINATGAFYLNRNTDNSTFVQTNSLDNANSWNIDNSSNHSTDYPSQIYTTPVRTSQSILYEETEQEVENAEIASNDNDDSNDPTLTGSAFSFRSLRYRPSLVGSISLGINPFANNLRDSMTFPILSNQRRTLAVYTHEYDPSGTRLFTAGGPIASTFYGNVAALWE